jgi:hypothetical protein
VPADEGRLELARTDKRLGLFPADALHALTGLAGEYIGKIKLAYLDPLFKRCRAFSADV